MVIPVIQALAKKDVKVHVLGLTMASAALKKAGIAYHAFKDFMLPTDTDAKVFGEKLAHEMHSSHTDISFEESVAYLGLSYWDLVQRLGRREADETFSKKGRHAFLPLLILERVFDNLKPDIVVTTTSPRAELAARMVAKNRNILSVCISDLIGSTSHPISVNHLCVASALALEKYKLIQNVEADHFHVVGNPAMDQALNYRGQPSLSWRRENYPECDENKKFVLTAEQQGYYFSDKKRFIYWQPSEVEHHLEQTFAACQASHAVMLIRPHPSLNPEIYTQWLKRKPPGQVAMADKKDLYPLLNACDLVLSNNSTIMLDALYTERPVLLLHYPESASLLPLDEMGMASSVDIENIESYKKTMAEALTSSEKNQKHLAEFSRQFPPLPCAPKIAEIIHSI